MGEGVFKVFKVLEMGDGQYRVVFAKIWLKISQICCISPGMC